MRWNRSQGEQVSGHGEFGKGAGYRWTAAHRRAALRTLWSFAAQGDVASFTLDGGRIKQAGMVTAFGEVCSLPYRTFLWHRVKRSHRITALCPGHGLVATVAVEAGVFYGVVAG